MLINLDLPEEIEKRLFNLAKATGRSVDSIVQEAVEEYFLDLDAVHEAKKALQDIRTGKEKTMSLEEARRQFGLD